MSYQQPHGLDTQSTPSLLIIDDDPTIRLAAQDLLSSDGFYVVCIETPENLPKLLQSFHPDALLIDINLPFMDGCQVCDYLRNEGGLPLVPIMMMTSSDEVESVNRAYEAGATDFIAKPINYLLLAHRVKYMLRNFYTLRHFMQQQSSLMQAQHIARLGYWALDIKTNYIEIEPYSAGLLGWVSSGTDPASLPKVYSDLLAHVEPEDLQIVSDAFNNLLAHRRSFVIQHRVRDFNGDERVLNHQGDIFESDGGRYVRAIGALQDITERKKAEQKVYEMAFYDQLTMLPNRAFLKEYWDRLFALHQARVAPFAVICVSLNHFSRISDSFGQDIADELIRRVGNRLNRVSQRHAVAEKLQVFDQENLFSSRRKKNDVVARVDHNSFVFFSRFVTSEETLTFICNELQEIVCESFTIHGTSIFLTATIGVSKMNHELHNLTQLIDAAMSAVNYARKHEHDRCVFFSKDMMTEARARIELEKDLRSGLKNNEFFLVYQPKLDLSTMKVSGFEALVRWQHPLRGLVPPNEFISVAEETGLIEDLGLFVLRRTCEDLKRLDDEEFYQVSMAVNISPRQFGQAAFSDLVSQTIHETQIDPERLELEITESIIMKNVDHASKMLRTLKDIGVNLALDDFGTGYSSFSYLALFPFDTLKIDQAFLRDIPGNKNAEAIIVSIVSLAKGLGMHSVAEGIETVEQLDAVANIGCHHGQGYLFSAPKDFERVLDILRHKDWTHMVERTLDHRDREVGSGSNNPQ